MRFITSAALLLALTSVAQAGDPVRDFFEQIFKPAPATVPSIETSSISRSRRRPSHAEPVSGGHIVGATWYKVGSRTANGERFNPHGLTAAHRTLPFGTRVRVTGRSGRSVVVRINDRGPFTRGYSLDLAMGAARVIGHSSGPVRMHVLN